MSKRIVVWGTSLKKVADEAQLLAHYSIIKRILPDSKVTILTYPRSEILRAYPDITVLPTVRLFQTLQIIARADRFVIAGGPFYEEIGQFLRVALLILWAKLCRVPLFVSGVTIFPWKTWWGSAGYRFLMGLADGILVRDRVAYQTLKDSGLRKAIHQGTDLRIILPPAPRERVEAILRSEGLDPARPLIGLTTRYMHTDVPEWVRRSHGIDADRITRSNTAMAKTVAHLTGMGQVFIIPMHPHPAEDEQTDAVIRGHLPDGASVKILRGRYLAEEVIGMIQACDLVLAGRLGSALFAGITATPVIAIAYEDRMFDQMKDLGLEKYVFDWRSLDDRALRQAVDEVAARRDEIIAAMRASTAALRKHAQADIELYGKFLAG